MNRRFIHRQSCNLSPYHNCFAADGWKAVFFATFMIFVCGVNNLANCFHVSDLMVGFHVPAVLLDADLYLCGFG